MAFRFRYHRRRPQYWIRTCFYVSLLKGVDGAGFVVETKM